MTYIVCPECLHAFEEPLTDREQEDVDWQLAVRRLKAAQVNAVRAGDLLRVTQRRVNKNWRGTYDVNVRVSPVNLRSTTVIQPTAPDPDRPH